MSEIQFKQYNNIRIFAEEWRKYKVLSEKLDMTKFRNSMQQDEYIQINCLNPKKTRKVTIYLFDKNSKYVSTTQHMKSLLKKIKSSGEVILITYAPLKTYLNKAIASFKNLKISVYRHEIFDLIIPDGPLCYEHTIIPRPEVLELMNHELQCYINNLPKIFVEDPQCIWIGAEVGDVVGIKMLSDISGEVMHYRIVVPKSGRIIMSKEPVKEETADVDADVDVEDDEKPTVKSQKKTKASHKKSDDVEAEDPDITNESDIDDEIAEYRERVAEISGDEDDEDDATEETEDIEL